MKRDIIMRPATQPIVITNSFEWEHISIFLFFLLFALVFHFTYLLGPYALVRLHDTFDSDFLHYVIQGKLLLKYGLFGWYPDWAGGMPSFASQHAPYYLLSLVSAFVPLWLTYSLLSVGYMALAGYGMFRLLRVLFQMDRRIALFCGILFAFGNIGNVKIVINVTFNYLFPIFFVWSIELCQYRLSILHKSLRVCGLLLISFLSYPVLTLPYFPILHLVLVVAFGQPRENIKRLVLHTILIWTGYVFIFVPHIFALYDYIPYAQRTYDIPYHGFFNALRDYAYLCAEELRGQPAAILFICGLPLLRYSRNYRITAIIMAIYMGIFAFFQSPFRYLLTNTFFIRMDLTNSFLCINFLLSLSAALFLAETRSLWKGYLPILACGIAFVTPFFPHHYSSPFIGISALVMGLSLLAIIRIGNSPGISAWQDSLPARLLFMGFVIALATMGMAAKKTDFWAYQPYARLYNNHPELNLSHQESAGAVFRVGTVDVLPGVAQSYGLEAINGRGPLFNKYYKQFIKAIILPQLQDPKDEKYFDTYWVDLYLTRVRWGSYPPDQRPVSDWNIPLLLMMNVRYLIARQPIVGIEPFTDLNKKIDGVGLPFKFLKNTKADNLFKMPLYLYRFKETFARGYLVKTPVILSDHQAVMRQLTKQSTADLRQKVFFSATDLPSLPWPENLTTATGITDEKSNLIEYSPDRLVFKGNLKSPAFLVISNNYDPHWFAWVNGQPAPVYRANLAFQSVFINQTGPFLAVLEYHHPIIWWLHLVSLLGIALFIASAWGPKRGETSPKTPPAGPYQKIFMGNISMQKREQKRYQWLGLLGGVAVSLLYAAYLIYVILASRHLPNSELLAKSLGRNIYDLAVVPMVGILLSIWIFIYERHWHLFSTTSHLADSPLPNDPSGRESSLTCSPQN